MSDQVLTQLIAIVAGLATMVTTVVGLIVRGSMKQMADTQRAELEFRKAREERQDARENMQYQALVQIVGFMSALTEQNRTIMGDLLRVALREPVAPREVIVKNKPDDPIPVIRPEESK